MSVSHTTNLAQSLSSKVTQGTAEAVKFLAMATLIITKRMLTFHKKVLKLVKFVERRAQKMLGITKHQKQISQVLLKKLKLIQMKQTETLKMMMKILVILMVDQNQLLQQENLTQMNLTHIHQRVMSLS